MHAGPGQGGGERRGTRGGVRRRRRRGANVPGAVQRVRGLPVAAEQHVLQVPVRGAAGDAARRHHPVQRRPGPPAPPLPGRLQLRRVHRGGRQPSRQGQPCHAAAPRLPPQLRSLHWSVQRMACLFVHLPRFAV